MDILFNKKTDYYLRDDNNEQKTIYLKSTGRQLFLNETSFFIFSRCIDNMNFIDILNDLKARFNDIDENILKKDLLSTLRVFEAYGLIYLRKDDELNNDNRKIYFAGDLDYKNINEFIKSNTKNDLNFFDNNISSYLDPVKIRHLTMTNREYFIIYKNNGTIESVISIIPPNLEFKSYVVILNSIFTTITDKNVLIEQIDEIIKFIVNEINTNITKVRIQLKIPEKSSIPQKYLDIFLNKKLNFKTEAILHKEFGNNNLILITKFL